MKKTKAISLLISLVLVVSLIIPAALALPAAADDEQGNNGMVISKTAEANGDGTYTITLEAYATGEKVITEVKEDIPTDIVLVLDQSGSMADYMSSAESYSKYLNTRNADLYEQRFNGGRNNLYYPLRDGYVQLQVDRESVNTYTAMAANTTNSQYYSDRNNLYIKDSNGEYQKLTVKRTGSLLNRTYTYTVNGQLIAESNGNNTVPDFGSYGPVYRAETTNQYTYFYTLQGQNRVVVETSQGSGTVPAESYYQLGTVNLSRLDALKSVVTAFSDSVAAKAAGADGVLGSEDDVNHRVAVVGFASRDGYGNNTELLSISGNNSGAVGVEYDSITDQNLRDVLQNMDTATGQQMVQSAIGALAAQGATQADLGMEMAKNIFDANPVPEGEKRNRVVVFLTDGSPTSSNGFERNVADAAIGNADSIKQGGAVVYSVGVFPGADATLNGISGGNSSRLENQFMQDVSSNNGTPASPSYYLSAADSQTLSSIFQQISNQIESGGSTTTLNEETVIKDIIAPTFSLPNGADTSGIVIETYSCIGKDADDYIWSKNSDAMGASVEISSTDAADPAASNNMVSVTGFDFAENYVGTVTENGSVTYRGNKIVIKINVEIREGFFGGNAVATNEGAGVYENADAENPVMTFPQPTIDIPLAEPVINVPDSNVYFGAYYSQTVPEDAVKMGATVMINGYDIDFSKANDPDHPYGLEPWQVEYVDISIAAVTQDNGGNFENIQEDIRYTVTITVSPKTQGSEGDTSTTAEAEATIHVFKPCLTYQDSTVWYGDAVPDSFNGNLAEKTWINSDGTKKHDDAGVEMLNEEPELTLTYSQAAGITDGKVNTKQDIDVDVSVKIGEKDVLSQTTFLHSECAGGCSWQETDPDGTPAFLLHVQTCTLTVSKTGASSDEPYVFTVYKDGSKYSEVTVVGSGSETVYELPVGTYTVSEDLGWSWRYSADDSESATLCSAEPEGNIICHNTKEKPYWLNGFSSVVRNIFGEAK